MKIKPSPAATVRDGVMCTCGICQQGKTTENVSAFTTQYSGQLKLKKTEMWNEALALECVCVRVQDVVIFKV